MNTEIKFRVTKSVGSSTLSMRTVLSDEYFESQQDATAAIPASVKQAGDIDTKQPYWALTKVENGCVHSAISFHQ